MNQQYSTAMSASYRHPLRRYQYRYALFSAAGFKKDVPTAGTHNGLPPELLASWAARLTAELQESATGEGLILGFPAAPFILAMRPDSMEDFETFIAEHGPDISVDIRFGGEGVRGDWVVTPVVDPEAFRLSFGLPGALETWLLSMPEQERRLAADARRTLLPTISLFLENRLVQLRYEPVPSPARPPSEEGEEEVQGDAGTDAADSSFLRRSLPARPQRRRRPEPQIEFEDRAEWVPRDVPGWSVRAAEELMTALDHYYPPRAALIRVAARQGGRLEREQVYAIAEFPPDRTLRGLTRPTNRITATLIEKGHLPEDVEYPFQTGYDHGVQATHFTVPPELVAALRALGPPRGI